MRFMVKLTTDSFASPSVTIPAPFEMENVTVSVAAGRGST
jgi:hypothetical protein